MQPYAATQKISVCAARSASTTSGVIRLASTTGNPNSSALALTGEGSSFLPRPRTASGRVITIAISFPASTSEVNEGTAKSGVPINTIRIKQCLPSTRAETATNNSGKPVPSPSAITIQQEQIYPKQRKSRNKSSSLNKGIISKDALPWPTAPGRDGPRPRTPWGARLYRPARSFAAKRECLSTG